MTLLNRKARLQQLYTKAQHAVPSMILLTYTRSAMLPIIPETMPAY